MVSLSFRPLTAWPEGETAKRTPSPFRVDWEDTVELLRDELRRLRADHAVIEVGLRESDFRVGDGMPKMNAPAPWHPGVRVAFDAPGKGPLIYATDSYKDPTWSRQGALTGWQANLRAVALGLEALRAVDRYGITRKGEQYTGFRALPAGQTGSSGVLEPPMTRSEAVKRLLDAAGWDAAMADTVAGDSDLLATLFKRAKRAAHPDTGGNRTMWDDVNAAWGVLHT
jgi:hypothetical protein